MEEKDLVLSCNITTLYIFHRLIDGLPNVFSQFFEESPEDAILLMSVTQLCLEGAMDIVSAEIEEHPMVVRDEVFEFLNSLCLPSKLADLSFIVFSALFDAIREHWIANGGDYYESAEMLRNGLIIYDLSDSLPGGDI